MDSNEHKPKNLSKTPIKVKLKIASWLRKPRKGGSNKGKKKAFRWNIERWYQKPHGCPLILKAHLHVENPHLKPLVKKKNKQNKAKEDTKDPYATKGATELSRGDEPRK